MIVQANHVFGAIAYNLTKGDTDPNYAALDADTKARYGALAPFFLSFIGGGDIRRYSAKAVGKALYKNSPGLLKDEALAEAVASAFLDVATTITDSVY